MRRSLRAYFGSAARFAVRLVTIVMVSMPVFLGGSWQDVVRAESTPRLHVSPSGDDANPCTKALPCGSLNRAYQVAKPGQTIEVGGGTYDVQYIRPDPAKARAKSRVVFLPARGENVSFASTVYVFASHVEFRNLTFGHGGSDRVWESGLSLFAPSGLGGSYACVTNIRFVNVSGSIFLIENGVSDVTFKGGSWGNKPDRPGVGSADPSFGFDSGIRCPHAETQGAPANNITFDGVRFGNNYPMCVGLPDSCLGGAHPDCLQWIGYTGAVTIKNSTFDGCYGDFVFASNCIPAIGCPHGQDGVWGPVVFENNFFGDAEPSRVYTVSVGAPYVSGATTTCSGWVFRKNTFAYAAGANLHLSCRPPNGDPSKGIRVEGNIFAAGPAGGNCATAEPYYVRYSRNLFLAGPLCGAQAAWLPLGYSFANGRLEPNGIASAVRSIFQQAASGKSIRTILRYVPRRKLPAPASRLRTASQIRALLADPAYKGDLWGHAGSHPALVSAVVWKRAQRALRR